MSNNFDRVFCFKRLVGSESVNPIFVGKFAGIVFAVAPSVPRLDAYERRVFVAARCPQSYDRSVEADAEIWLAVAVKKFDSADLRIFKNQCVAGK